MKPARRHFLATASALGGAALLPRSGQGQPTPPATPPSAASTEARAPSLPAVGTPIKLPEVSLLDGTTFRPAQAQGRVLVIYWWASTCPFCAQQSPEMEKLWRQERAKGDKGLLLLTLSIDRTREAALAYMKSKGYTFPAGFVTPDIQRVLPKPRGLPITLVLGRDGRVVQAERGQLFPEDVEQLARWND